jgi:four helix bundle protein
MRTDTKVGYEDLEVWQRAISWASQIVRVCNDLETERTHFRLLEQLESACSSVAMNIAEGKGRYSKKEFIQFLYVARGSLYETLTLLELFLRLGWLSREDHETLKAEGMDIARMLNSLVKSIKAS